MINSNSNFKSIYAKFKKIINRIFLFILAMPMGIPILLPFFILYAIYLSFSNDGRYKLRMYYKILISSLKLCKTKEGRAKLWSDIKKFWDGKN